MRRLGSIVQPETVATVLAFGFLTGCFVFPRVFGVIAMVIVAIWIVVGLVCLFAVSRDRRRQPDTTEVVAGKLRDAWAGGVR